MSATSGRYETGRFKGGYVLSRKYKTGHAFTDYSDTLGPNNKKRYFNVSNNVYGSGAYSGPLLEVDVENYWYTFAASTYTYQLSYNNRTASGHMGLRQYDAQGYTAYYYMCGGYGNTTLSRAASAGDTTIYITNGSGWYDGTTAGNCYATFYPAADSLYSTPYFYSRRSVRYANTGTAVTDIGGGEWSVTLSSGLPNWGYSLPAGTPISNGRGNNANWYIITGNTNHNNLNTWRTFRSSPYTKYRFNGGSFINGITHVRFLHLRNYTYRIETAGAAAKYYVANIAAVRRKTNEVLPVSLFQRGLDGPFY